MDHLCTWKWQESCYHDDRCRRHLFVGYDRNDSNRIRGCIVATVTAICITTSSTYQFIKILYTLSLFYFFLARARHECYWIGLGLLERSTNTERPIVDHYYFLARSVVGVNRARSSTKRDNSRCIYTSISHIELEPLLPYTEWLTNHPHFIFWQCIHLKFDYYNF